MDKTKKIPRLIYFAVWFKRPQTYLLLFLAVLSIAGIAAAMLAKPKIPLTLKQYAFCGDIHKDPMRRALCYDKNK